MSAPPARIEPEKQPDQDVAMAETSRNIEQSSVNGADSDAREAEFWGRPVNAMVDNLVARLSGSMLDAADSLEISLRQAGIPGTDVTPAVNAMVDCLRAEMISNLPALRLYAKRNVFSVPENVTPNMLEDASTTPKVALFRKEARMLDLQIANSAKRLASVRARVAQLSSAQGALQGYMSELEDIASKLEIGSSEELQHNFVDIVQSIQETEKDLAVCDKAVEMELKGDDSPGGEDTENGRITTRSKSSQPLQSSERVNALDATLAQMLEAPPTRSDHTETSQTQQRITVADIPQVKADLFHQ